MAPPLLRLIRVKPGLLRWPALLVAAGPVAAGLAATLLPAFGYWPALGGHGLSLDPWRALLTTPGLQKSAALSLWTGLASTALATGATLLVAGGLWGTRPFRILQALLSPLLAVPHAAFAVGFAFVVAPSGLLARAVSPWLTGWQVPPDWLLVNDGGGLALILALACKETPFLLLILLAAAPGADVDRAMAVARSLGYKPFAAFLLAVWPRLYASLRLPARAVLAYSAANVDMARILGPLLPAPLAVEVVRIAQSPDLERQFTAAAGAIALVLLVSGSVVLWGAVERVGGTVLHAAVAAGRRGAADRSVRAAAAAAACLVGGLALAALVSLASWTVAARWTFPALLPEALSLSVLARQAGLPQAALATLGLGLGTAMLALPLGIGVLEAERCAAREDRGASPWTHLLFLPLLVPELAVVLGLKVALASAGLDRPWTAVLLAQLAIVLPYVTLSLAGPWRRLDPRYATIARTLGLSPWAVLWRVRLPLLARSLLVALAVGFAVSAGQYVPTLVLGAGRVTTLATETVALASGGDRRVAAAYGLALAVLPFAAFWAAGLAGWVLGRRRRGLRP